jgi:hypothetical protein
MCTTCEKYEVRTADTVNGSGPVAQPGRAPHWQCGSPGIEAPQVHLPFISPYALGGLVAGEGCFCVGSANGETFSDGSARLRFRFQVSMASRDRPLLESLRGFLGHGVLINAPPRKSHWQPITTFSIVSMKVHHIATIPFAERYLLPSAKRRQFEAWRATMLAYEKAHPPRTRSICSEPGCNRFVRGRGLCRSHYYRVTGY